MILTFFVLCLVAFVASNERYMFDDDQKEVYPTFIPYYPVRLDKTTNKPVSRGRFELLGRSPFKLLNDPSMKKPIAEVKKVLQCAQHEPTISGSRGIVEIMKMIPPSKNITQRVCMSLETKCSTYLKCKSIYDKAIAMKRCRDPNQWENLVRVMNGKLYIDWPTCMSRPEDSLPYPSMTILMFRALDLVNDMKDSAFIVGAEQPSQQWNLPFPKFSNSPSFYYSDIPWPWIESFNTESGLYGQALKSNNFSESNYRRPFVKHYLPWAQRTAKAAYFGEMIHIRQVFFDQALLRPDLIEARWKCEACQTGPWNPLSPERAINVTDPHIQPGIVYSKNQSEGYTVNPATVGFLEPLSRLRITSPYFAPLGHFKYLVVLTGIEAKAASGRLASYLAYSGAVILLQHSEFEYHFSARLKPWVHYVPLTYSAADIINKIEWLKAHDDLAEQIAINGRNVGLSYLRWEDQFCYAITALETIAELEQGSDVLVPYNPYEITA